MGRFEWFGGWLVLWVVQSWDGGEVCKDIFTIPYGMCLNSICNVPRISIKVGF